MHKIKCQRIGDYLELVSPSAVSRTRLHQAPIGLGWELPTTREPLPHRIHAYPAKFPAFLTDRALRYSREVGLEPRVVGDVFCGCGTVAYEARNAGLAFWGCDVNPVATLIARTKSRTYCPVTFALRAERAVQRIATASHCPRLSGAACLRLAKWFPAEQMGRLAAVHNAILDTTEDDPAYRDALLCALSAVLKANSRWRQRSAKPALDPIKTLADPIDSFVKQCRLMAKAFGHSPPAGSPAAQIELAHVLTVDAPRPRLDLLITSPPYVTSYEYADLHQLSALWLGFAEDHRLLRSESIGSAAKHVGLRRAHAGLNDVATQVVFSLYDRDEAAAASVAAYYLDMQAVARRSLEFLSRDGLAVFVIGNTKYRGVEIDNASHLAESLLRAGYRRVRAARRRITNKAATPFRDSMGRLSRKATGNTVYDEEFILVAHQ